MSRRVAMKMLSSKASANTMLVQRFQREAKLCGQIKHPHVVGVFDCGFERGVHYLSMELVEGCTLAGLVDEMGPLPWQQAGNLILQTAKALDHVGSLNIVHRDIKPANILVSNEGMAKLADLGLAKQVDPDADSQDLGLTMQGAVLGSPAYMAPEQIRNAKDATHSADLYSLGATFYHVLTGVPPFEGRSATEVMTKVLRDMPATAQSVVPGIPLGISQFVQRTLAKEVAGRPMNAEQFVEELKIVMTQPDEALSRKMTAKHTTKKVKRDQEPRRDAAPAKGSVAMALFKILVLLLLLSVIAAGVVQYYELYPLPFRLPYLPVRQ
jgi:eukaryotic-like serine/threonine-protein kinase